MAHQKMTIIMWKENVCETFLRISHFILIKESTSLLEFANVKISSTHKGKNHNMRGRERERGGEGGGVQVNSPSSQMNKTIKNTNKE